MDNVRRDLLNDQARRVLVYRLGSLGDTLIALPSFHLIARAFPSAERRLLTNLPVAAKAPPAAAVLEQRDAKVRELAELKSRIGETAYVAAVSGKAAAL